MPPSTKNWHHMAPMRVISSHPLKGCHLAPKGVPITTPLFLSLSFTPLSKLKVISYFDILGYVIVYNSYFSFSLWLFSCSNYFPLRPLLACVYILLSGLLHLLAIYNFSILEDSFYWLFHPSILLGLLQLFIWFTLDPCFFPLIVPNVMFYWVVVGEIGVGYNHSLFNSFLSQKLSLHAFKMGRVTYTIFLHNQALLI